MQIGLLLNAKAEISANLLAGIETFCSRNKMNLRIMTAKEQDCLRKESILFSFIKRIESKLAHAKRTTVPVNVNSEICDLKYFDIIICWGCSYKPNLEEISTKHIITFCIDGKRLDSAYRLLRYVILNKNMKLQIWDNGSLIYSFVIEPARSLIRTEEIVFSKLSVFITKIKLNCPFDNVINSIYSDKKSDIKDFIIPELSYFFLFFKNVLSFLFKRREKLEKSFWNIKATKETKELLPQTDNFSIITHNDKCFWADPLLFKNGSTNYLFFEEFVYEKHYGVISVLEEKENVFEYRGVVLDTGSHLSFPFTFKIKDDVFMIPESGKILELNLYKCSNFPFKWEKQRTLLFGENFADTVVFFKEGIYYIFTSYSYNEFSQDEQLFLYYTDDLINGTLKEHPCNPISLGKDHSRMAGGFFYFNNILIRPAQDCTDYYGENVKFMKILKLSVDDYMEEPFSMLAHSKDKKGVHTYSRNDDYVIIDER